MTVRELIAQLRKTHQDAEVRIKEETESYQRFFDLTEIETIELDDEQVVVLS